MSGTVPARFFAERTLAMNTSSSLVDAFLSQLQGAPLDQLSQQLGTDHGQTREAVGAALPLLMGALGRNAAEPQGAQQLWGALQRDHTPAALGALGAGNGSGLDLGGLLGSLLGGSAGAGAGGGLDGLGGLGSLGGMGGGGGMGGAGNGAAILGHIFGGQQQRAEAGLGQATGLGSKAGSLLQMLAPLVMAFLAQRMQAGQMDPGNLGQVLGQEREQLRQQGGIGGGLLGSLLDQDGDGQLGMSDLMKIGGSLLGGRR